MAQLPLIAILRGLTPAQAPAIGQALVDSGFAIIEVPLNSPEPLQSIKALTGLFPQTLIGAGTVLNSLDVPAGASIVVAGTRMPMLRAARSACSWHTVTDKSVSRSNGL
jgi:2-dehydro-3-deoxyphosphogalactonate aldolase